MREKFEKNFGQLKIEYEASIKELTMAKAKIDEMQTL